MKKYVKASFDSDKDYLEWEIHELRHTLETYKNSKSQQAEAANDIEIESYHEGEADAFEKCLNDFLGDFERHLANHGMID